jgi:hypothetical protein
MKKIILLFIVSSLPFLATPSFASRAEIIDETLTRLESPQPSPSEKRSPYVPEREAAKPIAEPEDISGTFYISGGHDANHMHYKELSGKNTLDEDYGKLRGFYITMGYKSKNYIEAILGKPFIEGYFRRYDELITYDGASELGPLEFQERAVIKRFGIKFGAYKDFSTNAELCGYFDVGRRIWQRGENEVIGGALTYAEKYWWTYFGFGAGINYELVKNLRWGVEVEWMFSPEHLRKMRADLYEGGTFNLGWIYGAEVKMPIKYNLLRNISFDVTPYFTYWDIKNSDLVLINGSYYSEPDSTTHIEGLLVGLTYSF